MSASSVVRLVLEGQSDGASAALDAVEGGLGNLGGSLGGFAPSGALAAGAVAGFAAIGAAAIAVGGYALGMSEEFDTAMNRFSAQTGTAQEDLGQFRDIATEIFTNNWGDSLGDVTDAMAQIRQVTGAGGDELQNMTQSALIMRDVFDLDVGESISAVNTLMSEFGLTSEQSFDFITSGIQNGLNAQGDFLDSIGEYSNLFSDAGFQADQFYSLMETGAAGGALGTDKISDSFKEFQIRLLEGGDEVSQALGEMAFDTDPMFAMLADGSYTAAEAFDHVTQALAEIEDPLQRNRLQTALFGTQAEDLGVNFLDGLSLASTSLEDMVGTTNAAGDAVSQGLGPALETFKRQVSTSLLPLGDWLGEMLGQATPHLATLGSWLSEKIPQATEVLRAFWVETAWPAIMEAGEWINTNIMPHIETLGMWLQENIPIALETLRAFWVDEAWPIIQETIQAFWDFVEPTILTPLGNWLNEKLPLALTFLRDFWVNDAWPAIKEALALEWEGIKIMLEEAQKFFNETLPNAIETVKSTWESGWSAMSNATSAAKETMQPVFDAITNFGEWLSGMQFKFDFEFPELPEWATPGSPIPLHTAWENYGNYLDRNTFKPRFDLSEANLPESPQFNPEPRLERFSQPQNQTFTPQQFQNGGGTTNHITINVHDETAAALLLDYLETIT